MVLEESGVQVAFLREPLEAREAHERLLGIARVVRAMHEGLPLRPQSQPTRLNKALALIRKHRHQAVLGYVTKNRG